MCLYMGETVAIRYSGFFSEIKYFVNHQRTRITVVSFIRCGTIIFYVCTFDYGDLPNLSVQFLLS